MESNNNNTNNNNANNPQQQFWDFLQSLDPQMQRGAAPNDGHQGNTPPQMPFFFPFNAMPFGGPGAAPGSSDQWPNPWFSGGRGGRDRGHGRRGFGGHGRHQQAHAEPATDSHNDEQHEQHQDEESEKSDGMATPDTLREGAAEKMDFEEDIHVPPSSQGPMPPPPPPPHPHPHHPPPPHPHHHHPHPHSPPPHFPPGGPFGFGPGPHRGRGGCGRGRGRGRAGPRAGAPWNVAGLQPHLQNLAQAFGNHPFAQAARDFLEQTDQYYNEGNDTFAPAVDTFNTEKAYVLHIALPGANKDDVGVHWDSDKGTLNIAGVVYRPGDEEFLQTLASGERKVGMFERSIKLPPPGSDDKEEVDGYGISARMENGLLIVTVPKAEKEWTEIHKIDIE